MGITFKEIGDDCELCPLHKQGMCHGLVNHGNGPVYPPCSEMDENTDVDAYLKQMSERQHARIEREQKEREKRREQEQKKERQRKRSHYSNTYCRKEMERVNGFSRLIKDLEASLSAAEAHIDVAKLTEHMEGCTSDMENFTKYRDLIKSRIAEAEAKRIEAKAQLAAKREECRQTREYQSIL